MAKKKGPQASYTKIIVDGKVVSVYKQSEMTSWHRNMRGLKGVYFHPATEEDYSYFLKAQKWLLFGGRGGS